ncbi:TetR/AcrR family transcriptional regulator [Chitinophaga silvisoli]|uniref:TetR/AcrR family transcriptional regulator n=1 Tax=Chitinophaga silvisoli TaxID=2291814 RepID=A0A3E1NVE0_9BACT|nr:TetR/AcrR family transcriptional regulator [Chitinophaga silvisoli]RFM31890.1 TetR/AcrR family transcriptional regulator [Chitinophaga silvisoli]
MARTKQFDEEAVLDQAMEFFWRNGYNSSSPQEILNALGLSRSSLYDTFGDKHTLFIKALKRYREKQTGAVIAMLENSEDVMETIKTLLLATKKGCAEGGIRGCLMVNSKIELGMSDAEVAEIVTENRLAQEEAFAKAIKKGQDAGQINKAQNPMAYARFVINTLWGLSTYAKIPEADKKGFDDVIKVTIQMLS